MTCTNPEDEPKLGQPLNRHIEFISSSENDNSRLDFEGVYAFVMPTIDVNFYIDCIKKKFISIFNKLNFYYDKDEKNVSRKREDFGIH